uniref:Uncharacterized protein n=1 Tax=Arundo donax TaxID=35708 RepID=A0A0A9ELV3_ARUDO
MTSPPTALFLTRSKAERVAIVAILSSQTRGLIYLEICNNRNLQACSCN